MISNNYEAKTQPELKKPFINKKQTQPTNQQAKYMYLEIQTKLKYKINLNKHCNFIISLLSCSSCN